MIIVTVSPKMSGSDMRAIEQYLSGEILHNPNLNGFDFMIATDSDAGSPSIAGIDEINGVALVYGIQSALCG
jgi:hypothetical protein